MTSPNSPVRVLAAFCATALAIGVVACGGDETNDDASGAAADSTAANAPRTAAESQTDEQQIKALVADVQKAFESGDGQLVCDSLTAVGQRDMTDFGRGLEQSGSCAEIASGIAKQNRAAELKQPPTRVVAVNVRGARAVALLKVGGAPLRQRYRKENGEWKVLSFGIANAAGGTTTP